MNRSTPGLPVHHQLPEFTQTHVHRVSDAIQLISSSVDPSPPAPNPSSIRVFSNESALRIRWPKYRSFSFSISPSSEYSGLIPLGWTGLDKRGHLNLGLVWWPALASAGLGGCVRVPLS